MASRPELHRSRETAESFGADAERYDRARPGYPDEMMGWLGGLFPGPGVLDVGCGTGVVSRRLAAAGCRVLGVEVDDRMAGFARMTGVSCETSKFEDWDAAGRTFDALVAGTSWHWVDPGAGMAKAASVLRAGGLLAAFWNVQRPPEEVGEGFAETYRAVLPDAPFYRGIGGGLNAYEPLLAEAEAGMRDSNAFAEPERRSFDWQRSYTRDEWLEQVPTFGGHSRIPAAALDELLAGMGAVIDAAGGRFAMGYTTVVVHAHRVAG